MQRPYSEAREDNIGMTRVERTATSIPRRSAAHGLSRRVPSRFSVPSRARAQQRPGSSVRRDGFRRGTPFGSSDQLPQVCELFRGKTSAHLRPRRSPQIGIGFSGPTCRWPAPSFIKLFACHRPRDQTKIYPCDADCASGMLPLNRDPRSAKCLF